MKCGPPFVLQKDCPVHSRKATAGKKAKKGVDIQSPPPTVMPATAPPSAPDAPVAPQPALEGQNPRVGASFLNPNNIDPSLRQLPSAPLHDPESPLVDPDEDGGSILPPSSTLLPSTPQSMGGWDSPSPSPSTRIRLAHTFLNGERQHPTREKPTFGFMKVNRHFNRKMDRILLAMQRDLPRGPLSFLEETSGNLFSAMKTARRQDVATVELQAAQLRAERDAARNATAEIQDVVEKLAARLRAVGGDVGDLIPGLGIPSSST
ncbi:hypothetical protein V5O48_003806 [Marasmius crinis-equi]|uniref:Uncharacterized protein n=1 Tax=Marasmius crinis-equi TaxID=585013 RepID=A0ABR3FRV9_9AGAR